MSKILFLTRLFTPHIGGVETHVLKVAQELQKNGHQITVITEQYDEALSVHEVIQDIEIFRIPNAFCNSKQKLWKWMWQHKEQFKEADIVHVHDVFWWTVPVLFLIKSKYFITFHGWEGSFPIKKTSIIQRQLASKLAKGVIQVGSYIEKWYGTVPNVVTYGGTDTAPKKFTPIKDLLNKLFSAVKNEQFVSSSSYTFEAIFIGRLSEDNDIQKVIEFFSALKMMHPKSKFLFVGDGPLATECLSVGTVTGFVPNVFEYMHQSKIVCANSYLSIMQAQSLGKLVCSFYSNPLKKDYLLGYPQAKNMVITETAEAGVRKVEELFHHPHLVRSMTDESSEWAKHQTWQKVAQQYEALWANNISRHS